MATTTTKRRRPTVRVIPAPLELNQSEAAIYMALAMGRPKHTAERRMGLHSTTASRLTMGLRAKMVITTGKAGVKNSVKIIKPAHEVIFPDEAQLDPAYFDRANGPVRRDIVMAVAAIVEEKAWVDAQVVADLMEDLVGPDNTDVLFLRQKQPVDVPVDTVLPRLTRSRDLVNPNGYGPNIGNAPPGLLPPKLPQPVRPAYDGPLTPGFRDTPEFAAWCVAVEAFYDGPEMVAYRAACTAHTAAYDRWRAIDPAWLNNDVAMRAHDEFYQTPEYTGNSAIARAWEQREQERENYINPFDTWAELAARIITRVGGACAA